MSEVKSIGEKIAELRKSLKMQQDEFADRLGVSRQALSLWETGRQVPRADKIAEICNQFGIDGSYFYSKDEPENVVSEQDVPPMSENNENTEVVNKTKKRRSKWWKTHASGLFDLIFGWFWTLFGLLIAVVLMIIEISPNINDTVVRVWMIDWLAVSIILFIFILICAIFYALKTIVYVREVKRDEK